MGFLLTTEESAYDPVRISSMKWMASGDSTGATLAWSKPFTLVILSDQGTGLFSL